MQFVSVFMRLNAYGVTESRYYVVIFGIFSMACAILLSVKPVSRNSIIALLAAAFAIISVIPPADAFTVSRNSQISRLESILQSEGILQSGKLTPNPDAAENTKTETTNIISYLDNHSSLEYIAWLPEDFNMYDDMKLHFGFEPTYPYYGDDQSEYFYASIDSQDPFMISGYDVYANVFSDRWNKDGSGSVDEFDMTVDGAHYTLRIARESAWEVVVEVEDEQGEVLIGTGLRAFADGLSGQADGQKEALPPELMTLETEKNGYRLRIVFQNISMTMGNSQDAGADYGLYVFFGTPE
jgi:hypothetical protein